MKIVDIINKLPSLRHLAPASDEEIKISEAELGIKFASDYKEYLWNFGCISASGLELTGICGSQRLNVVDITNQERKLNKNFPKDMYVIENTGIEGILMLQNQKGEVYQFENGKLKKEFNSLSDYLITVE